jgi:hypothetical protein
LRVVARPFFDGTAAGFDVAAAGFDAERVLDGAAGSFAASSLPGFLDVTGAFARGVGADFRAALAAPGFFVGLRFVTAVVSSRLDMRVLVLERGGGS